MACATTVCLLLLASVATFASRVGPKEKMFPRGLRGTIPRLRASAPTFAARVGLAAKMPRGVRLQATMPIVDGPAKMQEIENDSGSMVLHKNIMHDFEQDFVVSKGYLDHPEARASVLEQVKLEALRLGQISGACGATFKDDFDNLKAGNLALQKLLRDAADDGPADDGPASLSWMVHNNIMQHLKQEFHGYKFTRILGYLDHPEHRASVLEQVKLEELRIGQIRGQIQPASLNAWDKNIADNIALQELLRGTIPIVDGPADGDQALRLLMVQENIMRRIEQDHHVYNGVVRNNWKGYLANPEARASVLEKVEVEEMRIGQTGEACQAAFKDDFDDLKAGNLELQKLLRG